MRAADFARPVSVDGAPPGSRREAALFLRRVVRYTQRESGERGVLSYVSCMLSGQFALCTVRLMDEQQQVRGGRERSNSRLSLLQHGGVAVEAFLPARRQQYALLLSGEDLQHLLHSRPQLLEEGEWQACVAMLLASLQLIPEDGGQQGDSEEDLARQQLQAQRMLEQGGGPPLKLSISLYSIWRSLHGDGSEWDGSDWGGSTGRDDLSSVHGTPSARDLDDDLDAGAFFSAQVDAPCLQ